MKPATITFALGTSWRIALFGQMGASRKFAAVLALIAATAALVVALGQAYLLAHQIDATRIELAKARSSPLPPTERVQTRATSSQQRGWAEAVRHLNTPWSRTFDALEDSLPDDVALVSIEPEATNGRVRLQAEARALNALMDYAAVLRQAPAFQSVSLLKHETNEQDINRPARLTLEVTPVWSSQEAVPR